jgi:hypothetical protein
VVDAEDIPPPEQIREMIAEAKRTKDEAQLKPRDTKRRRTIETNQRKGRVNASLLRGQGPSRDETWTIRVKAEHIRAVKTLAAELSEPRAKVSVAALMDEAIELLLARYREGAGDAVEA